MILIKNMEMPHSCFLCDIKESCVVMWKPLTDEQIKESISKRLDGCPLTEVEPYGPGGMLYKEK